MARAIRIFPDPVLRKKAAAVKNPDNSIADALRQSAPSYAAGLAATQIGILRKAILWKPTEETTEILWNPSLEGLGAQELGTEGCLSLPGKLYEVPRWQKIALRARKEDWSKLEIELEDWQARIIQHEIDHLHGILISDRGRPVEEAPE